MSFHACLRERVVMVFVLALACTAPRGTARKFPPTLPTARAGFDGLRAEPSTGQPQEPSAEPLPVPPRTHQRVTKPPQVTYEDGQLTIVAENSALWDILSALHTLMGTEIDLPAGAADEVIWARLGPGPPRKVLSELLGGTQFNYVIQASDIDEDAIRSVLLTRHSNPGASATGGQGTSDEKLARGTNRRIPGVNGSSTEVLDQDDPASSETTASSNAAQTGPPPSSSSPQPAADNLQSAAASPVANANMPAARSSEQMIQQLQSLYQQRRQIQQNQTPQNQKPPAPNQ